MQDKSELLETGTFQEMANCEGEISKIFFFSSPLTKEALFSSQSFHKHGESVFRGRNQLINPRINYGEMSACAGTVISETEKSVSYLLVIALARRKISRCHGSQRRVTAATAPCI